MGRKGRKARLGQRVTAGVADESDLVAARDLLGREVADVAEQPADGCAQAMEDAEAGFHGRVVWLPGGLVDGVGAGQNAASLKQLPIRPDQNQRSFT